MSPAELAASIKAYARQLGFHLAGITTPAPPENFEIYRGWIVNGRHGTMAYLAEERALERRADPLRILPECRSILTLGIPYSNPRSVSPSNEQPAYGRVAAYAWGEDYHLTLPPRLEAITRFIEEQVGQPIPNRWYTDTGPVLERELAQRAGLGWIGKNSCLISPQHGSYFILAEILLGIDLPPDAPFASDHCGSCTRCIEACPTQCILPDRTLDAQRCISYLTIENKAEIPLDLRPQIGNWVFGCDICQMVCPWNLRFAQQQGDPAFAPREGLPLPILADELTLTPEAFNRKFKNNPLKRAKRRGYLRNLAVAAGNLRDANSLPALEAATDDIEPLAREHAEWARKRIQFGEPMQKLLIATGNRGKVTEIQALLVGLDVELVTPADLGLEIQVVEDGLTYEENAGKKARAYSQASGLIALADDSGLEVEVLGGEPGLHSARYSGKPNATDADRRAFLLEKLKGQPQPWKARFRATVAIGTPDGQVRFAVGECPGEILPEERGSRGFGYDPLFFIPQTGRTMAELSLEEKNRLSHRARAVQQALPILRELFNR